MQKKALLFFVILAMLFTGCSTAFAEGLPMDDCSFGPAPKDENYLSATQYKDSSIEVNMYDGRYCDTPYAYAHIKISHPSQLRTAPGAKVTAPNAEFHAQITYIGRPIARAVNAVVAMNGDYYTTTDHCMVLLRQGHQYRNVTDGRPDLLIVDKEGNFSALQGCKKADYAAFYKANKENLYQVFSFGPVMCKDGVSIIPEDYTNRHIGAVKPTQRSAIAQIGPLEYLMITCEGPQSENSVGLTIYQFAALCEELGKKHSENGCMLAFNMDGGNSSTLLFKGIDEKSGKLNYVKYNCPEIERDLSDIIYFATLEE